MCGVGITDKGQNEKSTHTQQEKEEQQELDEQAATGSVQRDWKELIFPSSVIMKLFKKKKIHISFPGPDEEKKQMMPCTHAYFSYPPPSPRFLLLL